MRHGFPQSAGTGVQPLLVLQRVGHPLGDILLQGVCLDLNGQLEVGHHGEPPDPERVGLCGLDQLLVDVLVLAAPAAQNGGDLQPHLPHQLPAVVLQQGEYLVEVVLHHEVCVLVVQELDEEGDFVVSDLALQQVGDYERENVVGVGPLQRGHPSAAQLRGDAAVELVLLGREHAVGLVLDDAKLVVVLLPLVLLPYLLVSADVDVLLSPRHLPVDVYPPPRQGRFELYVGDAPHLALQEALRVADHRVAAGVPSGRGLPVGQFDIADPHVFEGGFHILEAELLPLGAPHKLEGRLQ